MTTSITAWPTDNIIISLGNSGVTIYPLLRFSEYLLRYLQICHGSNAIDESSHTKDSCAPSLGWRIHLIGEKDVNTASDG